MSNVRNPELSSQPIDLPWSWEPQKRLRQKLDFIRDVQTGEHYDDEEDRTPLQELCDEATHKYFIPQHAADMLGSTVLGLEMGEIGEHRQLLVTTRTEEDFADMIKRFEQELLGVEPASSNDGLHWWESAAGFGGGRYPIETVGKTIGISGEHLNHLLQHTSQEYVVIRSGNFLFDVRPSNVDDQVSVTEVYELTELGSAILEATLSSYVKGLEA